MRQEVRAWVPLAPVQRHYFDDTPWDQANRNATPFRPHRSILTVLLATTEAIAPEHDVGGGPIGRSRATATAPARQGPRAGYFLTAISGAASFWVIRSTSSMVV
jgi:hypothetical protein